MILDWNGGSIIH